MSKKNINEVTIPIIPNEEQIESLLTQYRIYNVAWNYGWEKIMSNYQISHKYEWDIDNIGESIIKYHITPQNCYYGYLAPNVNLGIVYGALIDLTKEFQLFMHKIIPEVPRKRFDDMDTQMYSFYMNTFKQYQIIPQILVPGVGLVDVPIEIQTNTSSRIAYIKVVFNRSSNQYYVVLGIEYADTPDEDDIIINEEYELVGVHIVKQCPPYIILSNSKISRPDSKTYALLHQAQALTDVDEPYKLDNIQAKLYYQMNSWYRQIAYELISQYQNIVIEPMYDDIQIISTSSGKLSIAIPPYSLLLMYMEEINKISNPKRKIIQVPTTYKYLNICSQCGTNIDYLNTLAEQLTCPACGSLLHTHLNAAKNLFKYGKKELAYHTQDPGKMFGLIK